MRVVVEDRPIRGDDRYRVPGVPTQGTSDGNAVPKELYSVMLKTQEGELTIGTVGPKEGGCSWYALFGNTKYFLRGRRCAEAAARELLETASGLKRKRTGSFHAGVPVQDNPSSSP